MMTKLAAKAKRNGWPVPTWQIHEDTVRVEAYDRHTVFDAGYGKETHASTEYHECVDVSWQAEALVFDGWTLAAVVEPMDGEENFVANVPGTDDVPAEYRTAHMTCDHCNTLRNRARVYVLKNVDTGDFIQVGRTCLKDFLRGHFVSASMFDFLDMFSEIDEFMAGGMTGGSGAVFNTVDFMSLVKMYIDTFGWVSKRQAYDSAHRIVATADRVKSLYHHGDAREALNTQVTEAQRQAAEDVVAWVRSDDCEGDSDYIHNLKLSVKYGGIPRRMTGTAASAFAALDKWQEKQRQATRPHGTYVGTLKKRMTAVLTVEAVKVIEGYYGASGLHIMRDADGNLVKWFASETAEWLEEGDTYTVKMTPKEHDEDKFNGGEPCTTVTRVAVQ